MRVLAISDEPAPRFYEYYRDGVLADYDLILSCGDLKRNYLEFLVTMARCPLLYVHGNHDESFDTRPPEGCVCVDGQVYVYKGVRILGLGGSHKYRDGSHLYTQSQMDKRLRKLWLPLKKAGGVDVLLTHAPAAGLGDLDSLAHQGFRTFNTIILPMLKPALAVQLIFSFVQSWNNYFLPSLLLTKAEMKTVPIMIAQLRSADYSKFDMGKVYMFILLAILPVLVVYIILSKSIIKGVTAGSVKG